MKTCPKCRIEQPVDNFHLDRSRVDGLTQRCKSCNLAHNAVWYAANPSKQRSANVSWKKAHPERVRAGKSAYRAKKIGVLVDITRMEEARMRREATHCTLCGMVLVLGGPLKLRPSLDHIQPLNKGGSHTRDNLAPAHWGCNSAKGAR